MASLIDLLEQHRPNLVFEILSQSADDSEVTVLCQAGDTSAQAAGSDFENAKHFAAVKVLQNLISTDQKVRADHRFGRFLREYHQHVQQQQQLQLQPTTDAPPVQSGEPSAVKANSGLPAPMPNMSPLMYFNQISLADKPDWNLEHIAFRPSSYKATLTVRGRTFEGIDHTKQLAKQKAARLALAEIFGLDVDNLPMPSLPKRKRPSNASAAAEIADPMASVAQDEAAGTGPPAPKRKRVSGFGRGRSRGGMGGQRMLSPNCGPPSFSKLRNPLQVLNEFRRGISFKLASMEGPSHAPIITMSTEVDGETYSAQAPSKQRAKLILGTQILTKFEDAGMLRLLPGEEGDPVPADSFSAVSGEAKATVGNGRCEPVASVPRAEAGSGAAGKTPLMRLFELSSVQPPCQTWESKEENLFVATFTVNDQVYTGRGMTKQKAKHAAAEVILREVYNVTPESAPNNVTASVNEDAAIVADSSVTPSEST